MKKLVLVRHAKATKAIPELKDIDRPLTERGYMDARKTAREIRKKNVKPELIITSPAVRAITTALIFAQELKYPYRDIRIEEVLFEGSADDIRKLLEKQYSESDSLMLFGHNPQMEDLARKFSGKNDSTLSTCGIIAYEDPLKHLKNADARILFELKPSSQ